MKGIYIIMGNLLKKYNKAKSYYMSTGDILRHFIYLLKDKIGWRIMLRYLSDDKNLAEAVHSARFYKKLRRHYYNEDLTDQQYISDSGWQNTPMPKIVWWCWLQGESQIPELSLICLHSLKKNLPNYQIKIITLANLKDYITLPQVIINKYKAGWISGALFSDIIRLSLLANYGGVWIDSTVYCTDNKLIKEIEKEDIFMYQTLLSANDNVIKMSSWLIATKKNNPYIVEASKVLINYCKNSKYIEDYFVCHIILTMLADKYSQIWNRMDIYNNTDPHMLQLMLNREFSPKVYERILSNASFHKLNRHIEFKPGNTFYNYLKAEDSLCARK